MSSAQDAFNGALNALLDRGEDRGCLAFSEVDEFAQALDLEEGDLGGLYEQLDARGIALRDDCGRESAPAAPIAATRPTSSAPRPTATSQPKNAAPQLTPPNSSR